MVTGPAVLGLAMATATVVVAALGRPAPLLAALVVALVAVPVLLLLARREPGGAAAVLGVGRPRSAAVGVIVVGGAAAVVIGADALAGGVRVTSVHAATLLTYLAATVVPALLQEAVPEELAFRGLAYGVLARRSVVSAAVITTGLFVLVPPAAIALGTAVAAATVRGAEPLRFAPPGQAPVDYVVLLALFGAVLVLLRILTRSLWACVAAHVTFLLVNRVLLGRPGTGVGVELPPDGELLVPAYLMLAIAGLGAALAVRWGRARRRREVAAVG